MYAAYYGNTLEHTSSMQAPAVCDSLLPHNNRALAQQWNCHASSLCSSKRVLYIFQTVNISSVKSCSPHTEKIRLCRQNHTKNNSGPSGVVVPGENPRQENGNKKIRLIHILCSIWSLNGVQLNRVVMLHLHLLCVYSWWLHLVPVRHYQATSSSLGAYKMCKLRSGSTLGHVHTQSLEVCCRILNTLTVQLYLQ